MAALTPIDGFAIIEPSKPKGREYMNKGNGLGFWGVVGAVLVALVIFALCG